MLGRRNVLGGAALGLLALTACDADDLRPPEDESAPAPTPSRSAETEPDADVALAETMALRIAAMLVLVEDVRRTWPRLRGRLQPIARMHRAHAAVLPADGEPPSAATDLVGTPADALSSLRQAEDALHRDLVSAAGSAQSGALARLLASMSASVAQHSFAHLPQPPLDGGPR